jgi:hypothetical protein
MIAPFDVFEEDAAGPMWMGEVHSVEEAKTLVKSLPNYSKEKKYFILGMTTSDQFDLNLDETPRDSVVE